MNANDSRSTGRVVGAIAAGVVVFLLMDAAWLSVMASRLYRPAIGHLMREDFDAWAAAAFYLVYFAGVAVFAIAPARSTREAWGRGAMFGFVAYATYDLTNQATLRDWAWHVTLADLAWGALVTSSGAAIAFRVLRPGARAGSPPGPGPAG